MVPDDNLMIDWYLTETFLFDHQKIRWDVQGIGPPVVLVHGTPWSSFNLRHLIQSLAEDYQVYYFDLLGYGQSEKSKGDVSLRVQPRILQALLQYWDLIDPIAIGHDFGGTTVLRAHLLHGQAFAKMVLIDPVAISPWGSDFFRQVHQHERVFSTLPDYIHESIVRAYVQSAAHHPLSEAIWSQIVSYWTGSDGKLAFYRQIAQADIRYTDELMPLYPEMTTSTLLLWGEKDNWVPVQKGEQLRDLLPQVKWQTIPGAGHLVIEEKPDDLLGPIRSFLQE